MSDPLRSVDKAYYASRTVLNLRGTREGRKNPVPRPSYRQKVGDAAASADKYYASMDEVAPASTAVISKTTELRINAEPLLPRVVRAFSEGATALHIRGSAPQIRSAQATVDMAVGRSVLTRAQSDVVIFITDIEPAPEVQAAPVEPTPVIQMLPPIMPLPVETQEESSDITEADMAAAFGVVEEGDD